jgi:hypothetical protein
LIIFINIQIDEVSAESQELTLTLKQIPTQATVINTGGVEPWFLGGLAIVIPYFVWIHTTDLNTRPLLNSPTIRRQNQDSRFGRSR